MKRLREPSTYAGLAVLLSIAGVHGADVIGHSIEQVGMGLAALLAVFLPESK